MLGVYGTANVIATLLVFFKLGWLSVVCVFLSFFFMSIMFPTIFALGIFGLGARAKKASSFIVMAIMGGALLPKLMGHVADLYDMSRGFIVPMFCFILVAAYGFAWPRLSSREPGAAPMRRGTVRSIWSPRPGRLSLDAVDREPGKKLRIKIRGLLRHHSARERDVGDLLDRRRLEQECNLGFPLCTASRAGSTPRI